MTPGGPGPRATLDRSAEEDPPLRRGHPEYTVTYPPGQEFRRDEDRERGWIRYRYRCRLTAPERLHCVTEQMGAGEWQPWGSPDGYTPVRSR